MSSSQESYQGCGAQSRAILEDFKPHRALSLEATSIGYPKAGLIIPLKQSCHSECQHFIVVIAVRPGNPKGVNTGQISLDPV